MRPAGRYKKMNRSTEDAKTFSLAPHLYFRRTQDIQSVENRLCEDIKTSFALHDVEKSEDLFFIFFFSLHLISGGNLDDENCGPFKLLGTLLFI